MRAIDADKLIENVEYACEANGDELSLKWLNWFKCVINMQQSIDINKNEVGSALFTQKENDKL